MDELESQFDNEVDLESEFDTEQDLTPVKQSLPRRIVSNIGSAAESVLPSAETSQRISDSLLEAATDTSRGVGQGLVMGAADEIGGALSAGAEALYNKFNPTDVALREQGFSIEEPGMADLYRQNQQAIQQEMEMSAERSPWLNTGGQIIGGMTSGSAIGGALGIGQTAPGAAKLMDIARNEGKMKALGTLLARGGKTYGQALPLMLTEGALSSKEGGLTSMAEAEQLGEDVVGSALFGLPAVMGLQAVSDVAVPAASKTAGAIKGKLQDIVADTPLLRQMKVSYGYGREGINPKSQAATLATDLGAAKNLTQLDNQRTSKLMEEIYTAKEKIGSEVSGSLGKAEQLGKMVDIQQDTRNALQQVKTLASKYPEIENNAKAAQIFEKLSTGGSKVSPTEAKDLIDYMDAYIGKFKSATNITPAEQGILSNLYATRQQFSNTLKNAIPEYRAAAERYSQFMKLVPETIIAGPRPVNIKEEFFGQMNNQDTKLFDQIKRLNQGTTREGSATQPVKESFVNTIKGLKTFEQQEAERLARGEISDSAFSRTAKEIEDEIKANSDDAVSRGAMDALSPHTGVATTFAKVLTGTGETGRAMSLSASNLAGRAANKISQTSQNNPVSKIVGSIYKAPHETNLALSQKLKNTPGLEKYGKSLEDALNSPDTNRRNQVLFTIMQNPNARAFVNEETADFTEPQQ